MDETDVLSRITGGNSNALSSGARSGNGGGSRGLSTKPRKARVERVLKKKEPQLVEAQKKTLLLKGHKSSQVMNDVLTDLKRMLSPNVKSFSRKNECLPFEDVNSLEFMAEKNDCSLIALGNHTKKRPHNLIIGRTFDGHILDLVELGVSDFKSVIDCEGNKKAIGSKPLVVFQGEQWDMDSTFAKIQNVLLDFFRMDNVDKICLKGIDHVIIFTAHNSLIKMRTYSIQFKKSGTRTPGVALKEMGPMMDLTLRRSQFASDDLMKAALRKPSQLRVTKEKNIKRDSRGDKVGRIHMKKQNFETIVGKRVAALKPLKRDLAVITRNNHANDDDYLDMSTSSSHKKAKY